MNKPDLRAGRRKRQTMLDPRKLGDRQPPHSVEAEQGVIGCVLLAGNDIMPDFVAKCPDDAFYDLRHRSIAETLKAMWNDREPIDMITVSQRLKDRGILEQVGGLGYLMGLPNMVPSAANFSAYVETMADKWTMRRMLTCCASFTGRVYEHEGTVETLVDEWERDALAVGTKNRANGPADIQVEQQKVVEEYEAAMTSGRPMGILTGFGDLDYTLGGMRGGELIVIAGERSTGKTSLAINIALRVAAATAPIAYYSMDGSVAEILHRMHCINGQANGSAFLRGNANESDMMAMIRGTTSISSLREKLLLYDCQMTETNLMAMARSDWQRGARVFFVDYLQRLQADGDNATERVGNAAKALKRLAMELDVPVVTIASLNRSFEGRPKLENLRQSGDIDYEINKAILLSSEQTRETPREVLGDIAKNKGGPLGEVRFTFFAPEFRFESAAEEASEQKACKRKKT